ncbi:restriction endonuclease [Macrococcoides goetzii]|nr:DEAD/DEAH box helicase family protein [Macrococcus goetzii]TDM41542.1 restriction endonuclease [Macrococcus goetzii]
MRKIKSSINLPLYEELKSIDEDLFSEGWETPSYITNNMVHTFRDYQKTAIRFFHYSQSAKEFKHRNIKHVLFNMATGSGKTDLMAGLILYLYKEHGFQNFLFLVNTTGVLNKTIENLINDASTKYLYTPDIEIEGERIGIKKVNTFPKVQNKNTIYLKLSTVQSVSSDIYTQKENTMGINDYEKNKVVVLGDEAHHFSASTKSEKETEKSWEKAIDSILNANEENKLLEFTATIDLENKKVYEKYKDKIIYRYALDKFINDRYSKNVKRIQSSNTDKDNMLNVILLSEYRRLYALENYNEYIKPVIMFKSQRIEASNMANEQFNQLVESLTSEDLYNFLERQKHTLSEKESETMILTNKYFSQFDDLSKVVKDIKREFASSRIINANDTSQSGILEKGQYNALNSLESPNNLYRVIFAVAKLTEGWDVLNLFDIVRLSDDPKAKGNKATTMSEAQLIGRGARYYPFKVNGEYSFTRRFLDGDQDSLLLETIHYHTINEPQYLKNLINALDEMNLPTGEDTKNPLIDINVKSSFKRTNAWKNGKIYYNETVSVPDDYYNSLEKYGIDTKSDVIIPYIFAAKEVGYKDSNISEDYTNTYNVPITFDNRYLNKVMNRLTFYHFENLKKYLPLLDSREEFLGEKWLNIYNRTIYITIPKNMKSEEISPSEKLNILERFFKDLSHQIKSGYSKERGTGKFIGYPINEYISNYRKRVPNYDTGNLLFKENPQNVSRYVIKEDYFVYDSTIINLTEKQLIDRIAERVSELKLEYEEVYLIRMDENMHRESAKNNKLKLHQFETRNENLKLAGFQPDFILYLENSDYLVQIFIEPKGRTLEEDQWKEDILTFINEHEAEILFEDEVENVKIKGVKFYTMNDGRGTINEIGKIALGKEFKGLSIDIGIF